MPFHKIGTLLMHKKNHPGFILDKDNSPLTIENFPAILAKHGPDYTIGYVQAIIDFIENIEWGVFHHSVPNGYVPTRSAEALQSVRELLSEKQNLLISIYETGLIPLNEKKTHNANLKI